MESSQQDTTTLPAPSAWGIMEIRIGFLQSVIIMRVALFKMFMQRIRVQSFHSLMSWREGELYVRQDTGAVTCNVTNCLIDFYQRSGIDCRGANLTANISNSTINRGYIPDT